MVKRLTYRNLIKDSLGKQRYTTKLPSGVTGTRISPADPRSFVDVARLLISCFCRHPRRVLEEIQRIDGIREWSKRYRLTPYIIAEPSTGICASGSAEWRVGTGE